MRTSSPPKQRLALVTSTALLAAAAAASVATPAPEGRKDRELTALDSPSESEPKFYQRGWFWPVVGGIVAAVIITIVIAESVGGSDRVPTGSLGTVTVSL